MSTAFQQRFADVAQAQYDKYHGLNETRSPLAEQIRRYWVDLEQPFPGVKTAWSAVFVSWCAKQAGATNKEFPFSPRHSSFINRFIQNAKAQTGVFRAHRLSDYSPKLGDILHNNRVGSNSRLMNRFDYDYASVHRKYESHSAVVVEVGSDDQGRFVRTIGGNESSTVGRKIARLDADGRVVNPEPFFYISVVETLL